MKVIPATYVDNQAEIQYPLKYIVSKMPDMRVYCSDEKNKEYLRLQEIEAKIIGVKIKIPLDISIAQNKCVQDIFDNENPDFVVWNQADIHITEKGYKIINDFCIPENTGQTCALGLMHIKLFHHCGHSYYGVNVIGREAWERIKFTGDGAYLGAGGADYCAKEDASIEIGYMTLDQCRNHMKQHKITWNSESNVCDLSDKDFVKEIIKSNNYAGLIQEDSEYFKLIQDMGLVEEYNKIKSLCQ